MLDRLLNHFGYYRDLSQVRTGNVTGLHSHDFSYGSVWDKEDEIYVQKLLAQRNPEVFEDRVLRAWNDHRNIYDDHFGRLFEPRQVTFKEDLVVNVGLTRMAQLATGRSTTSFTHGVSGTGSVAEGPSVTIANVTESARISFASSGDRYDSGTSMKFQAYFPSTSATGVITTYCVADSATPGAGTILFYTLFSSSLSHTQNTTIYVLQQTITQTAT